MVDRDYTGSCIRTSENSPSETVWKFGIALSSGCHLWVKGCEEALFGRLQRSDEDDGDPLQLFSKQFLEVEFSEVPRTKAYGILKNLWHPQESTTSMGSQASSLESR